MPPTRPERNEIYKAIAASRLDPANCTLEQSGNEVLITHNDSGSTFKFTFVGTGHIDIYRVQSDVVDGHHLQFQVPHRVEDVIPWITEWAEETQVVSTTPDLWQEMQDGRALVITVQSGQSGNTPYTQAEQTQIATRLQEIKRQIGQRFEVSDEQLDKIEQKLDEIAEASKYMGRKDWLIYILGAITALIISAIVLPGIGEHILGAIAHDLGHLISGEHGPPRIAT
jgi:hypothetical protein